MKIVFFFICIYYKLYEILWIYRFYLLVIKIYVGCILYLRILLFYFYFEFLLKKMCIRFIIDFIGLRYLIGVFYINFKLLWEFLIKLIVSYVVGLDKIVFWELYR